LLLNRDDGTFEHAAPCTFPTDGVTAHSPIVARFAPGPLADLVSVGGYQPYAGDVAVWSPKRPPMTRVVPGMATGVRRPFE
jgi:hypothetical protein